MKFEHMTPPLTPLPRLMVISSGSEHMENRGLAILQAQAIAQSRPVIFHLREKGLDASRLFDLACSTRQVLDGCGSLLLINDRADIALASHAAGFHLPESARPAPDMRKVFPGLLAGKSVHSVQASVDAAESGVDYLLFGPIFATPSKEPFGPPQGLDKLETVCRSTVLPVFAVGGITPERSFACIGKGAWGIAAIKPFLDISSLPVTIESFSSCIPS
jgi:thiamine-phosphate pyrophosphorylase